MTTQNPSRRAASTQLEVARLVDVIAALREHCPWTAALTHESLTTYVLEEAHELIEAIETGGGADLANELGDLLLQVVLHARLGEEGGSFDLASVAGGLSAKLIRRSPHVFHPDGTLRADFPATVDQIEATWERVKAQERAAAGLDLDPGEGAGGLPGAAGPSGPFAGIPAGLPALAAAQKTIERAQRAGFGLPAATAAELDPGRLAGEAELGMLLFEVVQAAHSRGLDAERALRHTVRGIQNETWSAPPQLQGGPGRKL